MVKRGVFASVVLCQASSATHMGFSPWRVAGQHFWGISRAAAQTQKRTSMAMESVWVVLLLDPSRLFESGRDKSAEMAVSQRGLGFGGRGGRFGG